MPPTPFFGLGGEAHQSTGCAKLLVQAACYIFARDGAHMNGSGSCREGSRVLRGPNGSLGTVRKLLQAAAWRGHRVGPELGRPRWQARAGEATAGKATAGSCSEGSRVLRGPKGSLGTVRKLSCCLAWPHSWPRAGEATLARRRLEAAEKVRGF